MMKRSLDRVIVTGALLLLLLFAFAIDLKCFLAHKSLEALDENTPPKNHATQTIKTEPTETEPTQVQKNVPLGEFKITGYDAYCEHCCGKSDGITASMTDATVGRTVAMNRTDMKALGIEYGDVIIIEGIGERVVEDTGCGRGVIDVACLNHDDCYKITGTYNVLRKECE